MIMRADRCVLGVVAAAAVAAAACDGGGGGGEDAPGACWPLPSTPGGQVELGTGEIDFMPMPDVLTVVRNASQSDPYIEVHSRIRGMPPGSPDDPFDPKNPRTRVRFASDELGLALGNDCPASIGYVAAPESGAFDLLHSLRIGFGSFPIDQVSGKSARITIEVVGSNRLYASDEKVVVLMAP